MRVDRAALQEHTPHADPELYHTPALPGLGDVDFGRFAGLLYEAGYRGPVCVEVEDRAFEGSEADVERALAISRDVLRPYWPAGGRGDVRAGRPSDRLASDREDRGAGADTFGGGRRRPKR